MREKKILFEFPIILFIDSLFTTFTEGRSIFFMECGRKSISAYFPLSIIFFVKKKSLANGAKLFF
jgi:hypothetical protein